MLKLFLPTFAIPYLNHLNIYYEIENNFITSFIAFIICS